MKSLYLYTCEIKSKGILTDFNAFCTIISSPISAIFLQGNEVVHMENKRSDAKWVVKTTAFTVVLITVCFAIILGIMLSSYGGGTDISQDIIGTWDCIQFYKNQESFLVPESQSIVVKIDSGSINLQGSKNASIFRGADRTGTYTVEGGSTLIVDMGGEMWTCSCVFTSDGLLRMTISEAEVVLYLQKR